MKIWADRVGLALLTLVTLFGVAVVITLVLSIKWRHDTCNARGAEPAKTDSGHIVCLHADGTVSRP